MTPLPTALESPLMVTLVIIAATLGVIWLAGRALVPWKVAADSKLLRLALIFTSGLLFTTSLTATVVMRKPCYLTVIAALQIGFAAWCWWKERKAETQPTWDRWNWREVLMLAAITLVASLLFHLPYQRLVADGGIREVHEDLGYFGQQVLALPEAKVAGLWGPTLGDQAASVTKGRDLWYHWGSILLATGIKEITGLPALTALLEVSCTVLNVILMVVAGSVIGSLVRLPVAKLVALGAISVVATQMMKMPGVLAWMSQNLPYGFFQHGKVSLAIFFAYKFEAIVVLTALASWLGRYKMLAVFLLFCAAVSAPHTVAACGVTGAGLALAGFALRKPEMWRTGLGMIGTLLAAWATVLLLGAQMATGEGQGLVKLNLEELRLMAGHGTVDTLISLLLSALSLPGILYLIRARDDEAAAESRMIGWMALSGIAGSCGAYHLMHRVTDSFHVMLFVQTVLVMPAGVWGLVRFISRSQGLYRYAGMAIVAAGFSMGVHDLLVPRFSRIETVWRAGDLEKVKQVLNGQTFGYYSKSDRGWWISKYGVLASMLDSRCVRLNESTEEQQKASSRFYGFSKPYELLPPMKDESINKWSLRFAQKLGVHMVVETWQDRLPKSILLQARLTLSVPGINVYSLDGPVEAVAKR